MYRATPLSYYISGIISTGLSGVTIRCSPTDIANIPFVPSGETCGSYLASYLNDTGVQLMNPAAATDCQICPWANTDAILATYGIMYSERWRNWGITIAYNCFNIGACYLLWWLVKVPKKGGKA
jgi:ATP-binding cassette, subfamily G (WHITE), member 2, PDR